MALVSRGRDRLGGQRGLARGCAGTMVVEREPLKGSGAGATAP